MNKKILHLQIPLMKSHLSIKDNLAISPRLIGDFVKMINEKIGEEYTIIASPFNPSVYEEGHQSVCNFQMDQLSKDDLLKLLDKDIEQS